MNRTMRSWAVAMAGLVAPAFGSAQSVEEAPVPESSVETRIWVDRGEDPVLRRGDRVRVYYRTSANAFVAIFHIDTNGGVRLLYPSSPEIDPYIAGGRDYRLLFPRASQWYVDEDPGIGYYFIVASPEPLDFRDFRFSYDSGGWDLSFAGRTVYEDPFAAMDEYIARLIPDWETADYALDYLEYHVGDRHDYPRFLCYDCHGFTPYSTWNPYLSACSSFQVVVYNDPWYYPINRYQGGWVVWARPPVVGQPRYVFRERGPGDPWGPVVEARPSIADRPGIPGDAVQRRSGAGIGSGGRVPLPGRPGSPGTIERRSRPSSSLDRDARSGGRPVLERRSGSGSRSGSESPGALRRPGDRGGGSGIPGTLRVPTPSRRERPSAGGTGERPGSTPTTRATPGSRGGTVIRRAPTSRSSGGRATPTRVRPSGRVQPSTRRPGTGSGGVQATPRSRPGGTVRPAPRRPSGGSVQARPRSSGGVVRSAPRSRGGGVVRTPSTNRSRGSVRSGPSRSRSGGAVRSGSGGSRSGGVVRRAPVRSGGGSAGVRRAPPRSGSSGARPVRVRPRGGGLV